MSAGAIVSSQNLERETKGRFRSPFLVLTAAGVLRRLLITADAAARVQAVDRGVTVTPTAVVTMTDCVVKVTDDASPTSAVGAVGRRSSPASPGDEK